MEGIVFDIRRFTVHDGPGIRSTVFLKGCPLDCIWCQNPEGKNLRINLWYFKNKCIHCHQCIGLCPQHALAVGKTDEPSIIIDHGLCNQCGVCVQSCPAKALILDAKRMTTEAVITELIQDRIFYETSGGGITISGGDPLFQHQFALEILQQCQTEKIHTAIETCLYAEWDVLEHFITFTDLFIVDLKLFDWQLHRKYTGKSNELIKENLQKLTRREARLMVRVPLIPGITATVNNLKAIARFIKSFEKNFPVELINYNPLGRNKYQLMGIPFPMAEQAAVLSPAAIKKFKRILMNEGIHEIVED